MPDEKIDLKKRSREVFEVIQKTPFYFVPLGMMNALGFDEKELRHKPLIGIANSWNEINPGHAHLLWLADAVKYGIIESGGIPMQFNTVAPCDGFANGHEGMKYILPQRDIIADSVEAMVEAHRLDGLVTLSSCDKINPGMLMAALRLNIPTICVPGGPNMYEIQFGPEDQYKGIETRYYDDFDMKVKCFNCETYGACSIMGTANTFQCLMEAFGMTLTNGGTAPAMSQMRYRIAKDSGRRIIEMIKENLTPDKIMTRESLENALMVDLAIGGSTNSAIHLPAIANEMGIDFDLDWFNDYAKKIPMIANIAPSGRYSLVDLYRAGGIPAVLKRLENSLHMDCITVSGKPWSKLLKKAQIQDEKIIFPLEKPLHEEGGTVILHGNLAPQCAVVKQSAISDSTMLVFSGPAIVFEAEADALIAISKNQIENGSVLVIRMLGPKGGPGMPELLAVTASLMNDKILDRIALITDARFSGASQGPMIGHVTPEAYVGGPIAIVQNGDIINIDIPNRQLNLELTDEEIQQRLSEWHPPENAIKSHVLLKYRALVTDAAHGCVMKY